MRRQGSSLLLAGLLASAAGPVCGQKVTEVAPVAVPVGNGLSGAAGLGQSLTQPSLLPSLPLAPLNSASPDPTLPAPRLSQPAAVQDPRGTAAALPAATIPAVAAPRALSAVRPGAVANPVASPVALPAALIGSGAESRSAAQNGDAESGDTGQLSPEERRWEGDRLFDGISVHGTPLRSDWLLPAGKEALHGYAQALTAVTGDLTDGKVKVLLDAAQKLAESAGVQVLRMDFVREDGAPVPGLRIMPVEDAGPLNQLAHRAWKLYGVSLDYVPQLRRQGTAVYQAIPKRVLLPDFGRLDSYAVIFHELRHAAFSGRLRGGETSLFHFAVLAWEGRRTAPQAQTYGSYMSFEELVTHVRTLRHMLQAARQEKDPEALVKMTANMRTRALTLLDIMRTARYNVNLLKAYADRGSLSAKPITEASPLFEHLDPFAAGRWFSIAMPHAQAIVPVPDFEPPERPWWEKLFGIKDDPVLRAVRVQAEALKGYLDEGSGIAARLYDVLAGSGPDLAQAQRLADSLSAAAAKREASFIPPR